MEFVWLLSVAVLSLAALRFSYAYELFVYSHYLVILFFSMSFLHSYQSWFFTGGGLLLYVYDKCIRFIRSTQYHKLLLINFYQDAKVTRIVVRGSALHTNVNRNLNYRLAAGAHCWINIPQVSETEWHPFSVSSPPYMSLGKDGVVEFSCLLSRSPEAWTHKLALLAEQKAFDEITNSRSRKGVEQLDAHKVSDDFGSVIHEESRVYLRTPLHSNGAVSSELSIGIDGPYGRSIDYSRRSNLLLIAGGIGITPLLSIFAEVAARKRNPALYGDVGNLNHVQLVWIVRDASIFSAFSHIIDPIINDPESRNLHFHVFETCSVRPSSTKPSDYNRPSGVPLTTSFQHGKGNGGDIELRDSTTSSVTFHRSFAHRNRERETNDSNAVSDVEGGDGGLGQHETVNEAQREDSVTSRDTQMTGVWDERNSAVVNAILERHGTTVGTLPTTGAGASFNLRPRNTDVNINSSQQLFSLSLGCTSISSTLFQIQRSKPDLDAVFKDFIKLVSPAVVATPPSILELQLEPEESPAASWLGRFWPSAQGKKDHDCACIVCGPQSLQHDVSQLCFTHQFDFQSSEFAI